MKKTIAIFLILIFFVLFSTVWADFFPDLKVNVLKKAILSNTNVSQITYLYSPGLNARKFVVYIEMKDGVKLILEGVDFDFYCFFLKFGEIWRIGDYSPEFVAYASDSERFLNSWGLSSYPKDKNETVHDILLTKDVTFLLDNYKELLNEIDGFPLADEEFLKWLQDKNGSFKIPNIIKNYSEINGSSRYVYVKFPADTRAGGKWNIPKQKFKWREY